MTHRYSPTLVDRAVAYWRRGVTAPRVAKDLGISPNTVHNIWYHARRIGIIEPRTNVHNPIAAVNAWHPTITGAFLGDPLPGRSALDGFHPPWRLMDGSSVGRRQPWDPRAGRMEAAE